MPRTCFSAFFRLLPVLLFAAPLVAQGLDARAFLGEPFGVCVVRRPLGDAEREMGASGNRHALLELIAGADVREAGGRTLYPVWCLGPGGGDHDDDGGAGSATLFFLFRGREALRLTLSRPAPGPAGATGTTGLTAPLSEELDVEPSAGADAHARMLNEWWRAYLGHVRDVKDADVYEPAVELGVAAAMKRRLGLPGGLPYLEDRRGWGARDALGLLLGTESVRLAMQADALLGAKSGAGPADRPLPPPAAVPETPLPRFDASRATVEPMAMRVPKECFYVRFGTFAEFASSKAFMDEWGTLLRLSLSGRGADYGLAQKLERQLALKETALGNILGGALVRDVALIGADPFLREGAAVGVLFHARQGAPLGASLESLRAGAASGRGVAASEVGMGGRTASLLSAPGNAVRSFYVHDGDFHLVTTSRWMAEAFLGTKGAPESSLGGLREFRYARSRVGASEKGVFFYLSDPFFRNLVGPKYRIEMTRRAASTAEMRMLALVRAMADAEGLECDGVESLAALGLLPEGFGARPDRSGLTMRDGLILDSLRGAPGTLLPIADVDIAGATEAEAEAYGVFSEAYGAIWESMDPVFGTLKIQKAQKDGGGEKLELRLNISPYAKQRYQFFLNFLGAPLEDRLAHVPGTLVSLEVRPGGELMAHVLGGDDGDDDGDDDRRGGARAGTARKAERPYAARLFAGLRDFKVPSALRAGSVAKGGGGASSADDLIGSLRGYAGVVVPDGAEAGLDEFFPRVSEPDAKGYFMVEDGLRQGDVGPDGRAWARRFGPFLMAGTGRPLLEAVSKDVRIEKAESPAQIRLALGDFAGSDVGAALRAGLYARDRRASAGGAMQLQALQAQLRPRDVGQAARDVLGREIVCPLGGKYAQDQARPGAWASTAWQEPTLSQTNQVPKSYAHPALDGMKLLRLDFAVDADTLRTRLEVQTKGH